MRTTVELRLCEDRLDITGLGLVFAGRPVVSASTELVRGFVGDLDDLAETLREQFADDGSWCQVGDTVHTVTDGDAEVRLSPRSDLPNWHADYFQAGWRSHEGARIPLEFRPQYAAYVDRRHLVRESCLQGGDLRVAAGEGGAGGIDELVRHHHAQLAAWFAALDGFLLAVHTAGRLPQWATAVAKHELLDWHRTREHLTSAVLEYHHGAAGPRPETVYGNLCFHFSTTTVELVPNEPC
jgi:hypothetical protein